MGATSKISWTDATVNFWIGCTEVSPACDFCYAREQAARYGWAIWGQGEQRYVTKTAHATALQLQRQAVREGRRIKVFTNSLSDFFDAEMPESVRDGALETIAATPDLDWLILTKRHQPMLSWARGRAPMANVRLGVTVENRAMARARLPALCIAALRGWQTFISYEPALEAVDFWPWLDPEGIGGGCIHWLICGAESGPNRRPFNEDWARSARDACARAGVPFFYKQRIDSRGRKIELPTLDGKVWAQSPERIAA